MLGLYVHVPFCATKCPYCDFFSVSARPSQMDAYLSALLSEIDSFPDGSCADSVYFGGGTPILLGYRRLSAILSSLRSKFRLAQNAEITLEANPFSFPEKEYAAIRDAGFNRISFGAQSFVASELKTLGRTQTPEQIYNAVTRAKTSGFHNISVDLMIGIPHQTESSLAESIRFFRSLDVPHVSVYLLKAEEGTPFYQNRSLLPDDDMQAGLYLSAAALLESSGLRQYEISNYSRPGFECRHNLKYWNREPYLGFGPSAHSFYNGVRAAHPRDLSGYIDSCGKDVYVTDASPNALEESVMLGLRLSSGLYLPALDLSSAQLDSLRRAALPLEKESLLNLFDDRISLTPKGFLVSTAIIVRLLASLGEHKLEDSR